MATSYVVSADASGSGNFYPSNPFATYYHTETNQSNVLSAADNFLHAGDGVTLTIQSETLRGAQHTVTLWGYEYDINGNYLGLYITDSDDYIERPEQPHAHIGLLSSNMERVDSELVASKVIQSVLFPRGVPDFF